MAAIAKRYRNMGLPFPDLFNEGNTGLIRAVDKYDPERGFRFNTHAIWWIRQSITSALTHTSRLIRLTPDAVKFGYNLRREMQRFTHKHHRKPTESELADIFGVSVEELQRGKKELQQPVSMESATGKRNSGGDYRLEDVLSNTLEKEAFDHAERQEKNEAIAAAFDTLASADRITSSEIATYRLVKGLEDGLPRTLKEVAKQRGQSIETVRQIIHRINRALARNKELRKVAEG